MSERGQWPLRAAWLVAAVGLLTSMLAERSITHTPSLLPLFLTPVGAALANEGKALIACAAALALLFFWPRRVPLALVSAAAAVTMLFHVLAGHADAATTLRAFEVLDQWVHMLGVGVWVGGLAWLLLGLRDEPGPERAQAVRRFSTIAGIALGAVLLTGLSRLRRDRFAVGAVHHRLRSHPAGEAGAGGGAGRAGRPEPLPHGARCRATRGRCGLSASLRAESWWWRAASWRPRPCSAAWRRPCRTDARRASR